MENYSCFFLDYFVILPKGQGFMVITENQKDIALLHADIGKLVVKYQTTIDIIIQKRMVNTGFYRFQEKEELGQEVSLRLLEQADVIKKQYDEKRALLITFFSLKVVNICYQILRAEKNKPRSEGINEGHADFSTGMHETDKGIYLLDAFNKYEKILKMFYSKRAKIELCLQILYRIPVLYNYFVNYCKKTAKSFYAAVNELLPLNKEFTNKEIFHIITPHLNKSENKNNSETAAQRWMHNIINSSIEQMNIGNESKAYDYDKETFQTLVEKYYQNKKESKKFHFS